ncbi:MAG: D-alanyl-D-alanine carboxypeptidase [Methylotetracoccus sp.]
MSLSDAALLAERDGRTAVAKDPDRPMIPASTMKLVTALAAIKTLGLQHRFTTEFFRGSDGWLWVRGHGDPFLVSSELDLIARELRASGITRVTGIGLDDGYFAADVEIAGRTSSANPYDAPVTALAANFNTVSVVNRAGVIRSGEAETPLTPLADSLARQMGPGDHRVNLQQRDLAVRYFGELLSAKLRGAGIDAGPETRIGTVPHDARPVLSHANSHDLRTVLTAMLEYSNNFIANDLFLLIGGHDEHRGVTSAQARGAVDAWVRKTFDWRDHRIEDGAGLSHGNRLSARQLLAVVKAFAPYRDLLPSKGDGRIRAKTGTLTGVTCLAGYVIRNGHWEPFSLLINQSVAPDLRLRVAAELAGEDVPGPSP